MILCSDTSPALPTASETSKKPYTGKVKESPLFRDLFMTHFSF